MTCAHATHAGPCGQLVLPRDVEWYDDLLAKPAPRRKAKVRLVCTHGHSTWLEVDLGPAVEGVREVVRFAHEAERARGNLPPIPCAGCSATIRRPRLGQRYCSPSCGARYGRGRVGVA